MSMKRLSLALCAAGVMFVAATPAHAYFQVIRWSSGLCETWNYGLPTRPFPFDYQVMTPPLQSFDAALKAKKVLLSRGQCTF